MRCKSSTTNSGGTSHSSDCVRIEESEEEEEEEYLSASTSYTFCGNHGHQVELVAVDDDELVVRRGYDARYVVRSVAFALRFEEVVAHAAIQHALPVFLHEYVADIVDDIEAVDHFANTRPCLSLSLFVVYDLTSFFQLQRC